MNGTVLVADVIRVLCAVIAVTFLPELIRRVAHSPLLYLRLLTGALTVYSTQVIAHAIVRFGDPAAPTLPFLVIGVLAAAAGLVAWRKHDRELREIISASRRLDEEDPK